VVAWTGASQAALALAADFSRVLISPAKRPSRDGFLDIGFESNAPAGRRPLNRSGVVARLYVGNLPFAISEEELRELFEQHGAVQAIRLVDDPHTGRPRGFGFVDMDAAEAQLAMEVLHGKYFAGRILRVEKAK
jgi:RNA recognition motif-containing protein